MVADNDIDMEDLWEKTPEVALGLISARQLIFNKASSIIGKDKEYINGQYTYMHKRVLVNGLHMFRNVVTKSNTFIYM